MDKDKLKALALNVARLAGSTRLQDFSFLVQEGELLRGTSVLTVLERLDSGTYLIGAGPYTQGIHLLRADETVLGRLATPLEEMKNEAVDIFVNDAPAFVPREVSRVHAVIIRSVESYWILDRGSTCGTYVNGEKLEQQPPHSFEDVAALGRELSHGDIISLGPSHANVFVFASLS
jgi:pSer/pThr/pTyr-binding forkhead associated (FHA) protein